jgi:hypothetical protein
VCFKYEWSGLGRPKPERNDPFVRRERGYVVNSLIKGVNPEPLVEQLPDRECIGHPCVAVVDVGSEEVDEALAGARQPILSTNDDMTSAPPSLVRAGLETLPAAIAAAYHMVISPRPIGR